MQATPPRAGFDAQGRALESPADEASRRAAEAIQALDELDAMGEQEEQRATLRALTEDLDEDRLSDRRRSR